MCLILSETWLAKHNLNGLKFFKFLKVERQTTLLWHSSNGCRLFGSGQFFIDLMKNSTMQINCKKFA